MDEAIQSVLGPCLQVLDLIHELVLLKMLHQLDHLHCWRMGEQRCQEVVSEATLTQECSQLCWFLAKHPLIESPDILHLLQNCKIGYVFAEFPLTIIRKTLWISWVNQSIVIL